MTKRVHLLISGYVQGVGFRATVYRLANKLALTGTVKNLDSGEVEVFAQGEEETLFQLIELLKEGPGRVDHIEIKWLLSRSSIGRGFLLII